MGPKTRTALRSFQERAGLPVSGQVDSPTLTALGVTQAATPSVEKTAVPPQTLQLSKPAEPPKISPPSSPAAEVAARDLAPAPAPGAAFQTSPRPPVAAKPESG